jgi:hypothetical protein
MLFGSQEGMFCICFGQPLATCGFVDPQCLPMVNCCQLWTQKVTLVLDTSGSMLGQQIELLKEAAIHIVKTLTVDD